MATKAKKRVHSMPKLGRADRMIYWLIMGGALVGAILAIAIPGYLNRQIMAENPGIVAMAGGEHNFDILWMILWFLLVILLVYVGPYHRRIPIVGRKDIKYGPPAYPRIFPLLMKNKPVYWQSPKKLALKKKKTIAIAAVMLLTFLLSATVYPRGFYGRYELHRDGTVKTYDCANQQTNEYGLDEIKTVWLNVGTTGSKHISWYPYMLIDFQDGDSCSFSIWNLGDAPLEAIRTAQSLKERYGDMIRISGKKNLWRAIADRHLTKTEETQLRLLFEVE